MIDLHCHILPGLDDGSQSWDESLAMARMAAADGITDVVATPHISPGVYDNDRQRIAPEVARLNERLRDAEIPLRVHVGADVRLDPGVVEDVEAGRLPVLGGRTRYLLAELPHEMVPPNVRRLLYELQLKQIVPIITHPERNAMIQRDAGLLHELVTAGALAQVTAGSLGGDFGPQARRAAFRMLERGLVHVLASDAHGTARRRPVLAAAVAQAARVVGEDSARAMVAATPRAILNGERLSFPEPLVPSGNVLVRLLAVLNR